MAQNNQTSLNDLPRNPKYDGLRDYQLGIDPYVKGLVNFLKGTVTPMTIALQGEWGSGKTSLMYKLQDELCEAKDAPYDAVWINTWEYSLMSDSSQALLKIVAKMVTATESNNFNISKARSILSNLAKGVAKTALGVGTNDTSIIDAVTDIFTSGGESSIGQLQAELKKNIEYRFSHSEKKGIIFFIDDLDRLNPAVAVELLELLKNIFTIDGCIFVLAIDYDVVVKGLKGKFGELTDKNEREFRSFFDKIIQVPFAMPVSNYKPYNFIVASLEEIGYIDEADAKDQRFMDNIMSTTKLSVGNNPRSIKRLINILSLITCITKATNANDKKKFGLDKRHGKYVNYVVLAIQVQFPKIFRMLLLEPDFISWNSNIVKKMNVAVIGKEKSDQLREFEESDEPWEQALYAVCESDPYLKGRFMDLSNLLNQLREEITEKIRIEKMSHNIEDSYSLGDLMRESIQITSVTNFSADDSNPVDIDSQEWTDMVYKFHDLVVKEIRKDRPNWNFKQRRNTGNGGFNFFEPYDVEVPFLKRMTNNVPTMRFSMPLGNWAFSPDYNRPEKYDSREKILNAPEVIDAFKTLDDFMALLANRNEWIEWHSLTEFHAEPSNFGPLDIINSPVVSFKFKDIQRFVDKENIQIISRVIENFVEFQKKLADFFNAEFPK